MDNLKDLEAAIKGLQAMNRRANNAARNSKKKAAERKLIELMNGRDFHITFTYLKKQESGLMFEEIKLEGWDNASNIFEIYRGLGHSLKMNTMTLFLRGEKVKRIKFTY